jgi:hypothetical protein
MDAVWDLKVSPGDDANACAVSAAGEVLCWGESYSPPGANGDVVRIPLGPPPPSPNAAVFDPPHAGTWEDKCQIHQPCTVVAAQLPRCTDGSEAKDWSEVDASKLGGQPVSVRGPLVGSRRIDESDRARIPAGITLPSEACGGPVTAYAPIVIGAPHQELALESLGCRGDDSRLCCNVPAYGQTVVATGRLVDEQGLLGRYELHDAKLCVEEKPSR